MPQEFPTHSLDITWDGSISGCKVILQHIVHCVAGIYEFTNTGKSECFMDEEQVELTES